MDCCNSIYLTKKKSFGGSIQLKTLSKICFRVQFKIKYQTRTLLLSDPSRDRSFRAELLEVNVSLIDQDVSMRIHEKNLKFKQKKSPFIKKSIFSMYFTQVVLIRNIFSLTVRIRNTVPNKNRRAIFKSLITHSF